ncbi:hypothetical protein CPC08DRAFT_730159 [Agrocybe pediades]|nr:hypothetical protein CPC08DRAFT_730159 [Agrocybe pediades]
MNTVCSERNFDEIRTKTTFVIDVIDDRADQPRHPAHVLSVAFVFHLPQPPTFHTILPFLLLFPSYRKVTGHQLLSSEKHLPTSPTSPLQLAMPFESQLASLIANWHGAADFDQKDWRCGNMGKESYCTTYDVEGLTLLLRNQILAWMEVESHCLRDAHYFAWAITPTFARLECPDQTKSVLNTASKVMPISQDTWIAARRLLGQAPFPPFKSAEQRKYELAMVYKIIEGAVGDLRRHRILLTIGQWLNEAERCIRIRGVSGGVKFEKMQETRVSLDAVFEHISNSVFWSMAARETWLDGDVPAARPVLECTFMVNLESERSGERL